MQIYWQIQQWSTTQNKASAHCPKWREIHILSSSFSNFSKKKNCNFRYSTDYTDSCTMKTGQNNNGYVANAADYSPPSQSTLLLRNGSSNTSSDTTYYPNGQVPSVNSTLTRNSRTTAIDTRQDIGLPNVHGSFNSLQNSILSECIVIVNRFR